MSLRDVQARLSALGFPVGAADDRWGPTTEAAVNAALDRLPRPAAAQRTSPRGIAAIAAHEGFVPGPYLDSVGVWTCYIGHTASAGAPNPAKMPRASADDDIDAALAAGLAIFRRDLERFEDRVRKAFTRPLAQHQFDAAVSFDFNTGAISRATWVRTFDAGHDEVAAEQMMNWRKPPEIIPRREAEQRLFRDGTYPDAPMTVWDVTAAGKVIWTPLRRVPAAVVAALVSA